MKVIVGLGNPGEKYVHTRHNVGFMFVDWIMEKFHLPASSWREAGSRPIGSGFNKTLSSRLWRDSRVTINHQEVMLIKPQTFMNDSGIVVNKILASSKELALRDLIVVHDDLDIPLGEYKIQRGRGPKLHNGIESIEQHLGDKDFLRVRIGVDNREADQRIPGETYVLMQFLPEEIKQLEMLFSEIFVSLDSFLVL